MASPVPQHRPAGTRSGLGFPESHAELRATARSGGSLQLSVLPLNQSQGAGDGIPETKGLQPQPCLAGGCGAAQPGPLRHPPSPRGVQPTDTLLAVGAAGVRVPVLLRLT